LLIVDKMLVSGIKFVLGKVAAAVDAELNDDSRLREELLAAQMRLELGELTPEEFAGFEAGILARLREIRERQLGEAGQAMKPGELKITGVEATADFEQE
jgi:gas vesicle protein GvpG